MCADYDGTRDTLRERLAHSRAVYGSWTLRELEGAAGRPVAVPESEPGRGRGPKRGTPREELRPFHPHQVDAAAAELGGSDQAAVILAAETGLRTSEWPALERRDVDRTGPVPVVHVQRRVVRGVVKPYPKTHRSRRQVPLTDAALAALDDLPPRLNTPLLFPAPEGGRLRLDNRRTRERYPALDAARVDRRGPYHLRHTFATEALAGGVSLYHLHRVMGTSLREIDRTYGHLGPR